jgi:hypothetical protein
VRLKLDTRRDSEPGHTIDRVAVVQVLLDHCGYAFVIGSRDDYRVVAGAYSLTGRIISFLPDDLFLCVCAGVVRHKIRPAHTRWHLGVGVVASLGSGRGRLTGRSLTCHIGDLEAGSRGWVEVAALSEAPLTVGSLCEAGWEPRKWCETSSR